METQKTFNRVDYSRFLNSHVLFGLAIALVFTANSYGYVVAVDGVVSGDMGVGGTQADPAQYIIGAGGAYDAHFSTGILVGGEDANGSSWNQLLIQNGSKVTADSLFAVGIYGGTNNSVVISDGSILTSTSIASVGSLVGGTNSNNSLLVTGAGSRYEVNGSFFITNDSSWLQASAGGLINFNSSSIMMLSPNGNPYDPIRLDGGFCAWQGQDNYNFSHLSELFQYWSTELQSWQYAAGESFSDHVQVVYYETDEEGYAATGHWGLGGHSVASSIPEPSICTAIFGLSVMCVVLFRRCRTAQA